MGPGDALIYLADPFLHGAGLFDHVLKDGRILVLFPDDRWIEKQPDLASTLLRDRLRD